MRISVSVLSLCLVTACTPLTPGQSADSSYRDRTAVTGSNIPRRDPSVNVDKVDSTNALSGPSAVIR